DPLDNMRWSTLSMTVSPPAEGLEFICEDDTPTFDLGFRAFDAETGRRIEERTWTIVWQGDPLDDIRLDDDYETRLYEGVPEGLPYRWVLRAKGYRLAWGDETAFRTEGDLRVVEAHLVPGWGQIFKVTTPEREALQGVEILVDGESMGRTDERGMIAIDVDFRPRSLEFRLAGWHVSSPRVDPEKEGFGWGPQTSVRLSPNE
ncbi:MAG: hypothetical protein O7B99_05730, partial [Planctomycetota bacterium]|nr:hypothetical protein [Planctomycetota bacterium]